jgi:hypothetical protein
MIFLETPLCLDCDEQGRETPATATWEGDPICASCESNRDDDYAGRDHEQQDEARERWESGRPDLDPSPQGDGDHGDPGDENERQAADALERREAARTKWTAEHLPGRPSW